ncbi:hypothetical protein CEXT_52851 [Caerostris extrusa]|uniref:Uncharacterized protein n=1 Tax=Caerostris extrusa TaxID=172846 RepID=A0AAV4UJN0_CAEEX|nr:hypothetical protein CEXT_52851 [Caerostris extrusa]
MCPYDSSTSKLQRGTFTQRTSTLQDIASSTKKQHIKIGCHHLFLQRKKITEKKLWKKRKKSSFIPGPNPPPLSYVLISFLTASPPQPGGLELQTACSALPARRKGRVDSSNEGNIIFPRPFVFLAPGTTQEK